MPLVWHETHPAAICGNMFFFCLFFFWQEKKKLDLFSQLDPQEAFPFLALLYALGPESPSGAAKARDACFDKRLFQDIYLSEWCSQLNSGQQLPLKKKRSQYLVSSWPGQDMARDQLAWQSKVRIQRPASLGVNPHSTWLGTSCVALGKWIYLFVPLSWCVNLG